MDSLIEETGKKEILERAREHCFFVGMNDSGAELCKVNTPYGIAAIHYVQEALGFKPDATFISSPDMTITRNISRWKSGLGYGGKLSWGDGSRGLVILNPKPNACGMLVGGIETLPGMDELIQRFHEMEKGRYEIDGIPLQWDFYKSNHFVDLFEVKTVGSTLVNLPRYAFILHSSSGELRADNPAGMGIYYDKSEKVKEHYQMIKTPFGPIYFLTGSHAEEYYRAYEYAREFAHRKRQLAAGILFGEYLEISNETHQGLISKNEMVLGCHYINKSETLFPVALRPDLPAYLVKGLPNYTPETVEILGFMARAKKLGVYDRLVNANILPHGGGYVLPDILGVNKVIEIEGGRYFEVDMQNDRGKQIVSEVHELPFEYRGRNVILRSLEIKSLEIIYKLIPKFILKI
ncbi:MAG: hypothetical protein ACLFQV_06480 [Vulcanimicrobiota bacterium]